MVGTGRADTMVVDHNVSTGEKKDASVYRHEKWYLYAEDVNQHMTGLPEVITFAAEVSIDDIQFGDPGVPLSEYQDNLRQVFGRIVVGIPPRIR